MIETLIKRIQWHDLGITDYKETWGLQEALFADTIAAKSAHRNSDGDAGIPLNHFIFCEHRHVYTLGKSGKETNLLLNEHQLGQREIAYYRINRGGDITYHGPGQIVGYPILDLDQFFTDIHRYLRTLEEAVILTLNDFGIAAGRVAGYTGVWIDGDIPDKARKICALGVKCSRWVTMHGFAFNVNTDLSYFKNIIPCGIDDRDVTSMHRELGYSPDMERVKALLAKHLQTLFGWSRIN